MSKKEYLELSLTFSKRPRIMLEFIPHSIWCFAWDVLLFLFSIKPNITQSNAVYICLLSIVLKPIVEANNLK